MFKKILVPLDGSRLAEQALPAALGLAQCFGGEILLIRVVPSERSLPHLSHLAMRPESHPVVTDRPLMDEAEAYLSGLTLPANGVRLRTQVLYGAPPELIMAAAVENAVDLIVMSTHGRAGLLRLLYGSVAEAVLRGATVPVLLVPSRACARLEVEEAQSNGNLVPHVPIPIAQIH